MLASATLALIVFGVLPLHRLPLRPEIAWPLIAIGYFLFDLPAVRIRSRRGVIVVAPTEMALVFGLLLTIPIGLVFARFLSALAAASFRGRRDVGKAVFNVLRATLVAASAVVLYRALLGGEKPTSWGGSGSLLLTVVVIDLFGTALVAAAISSARGNLTGIAFADVAFILVAALVSAALALASVMAARSSLPALLTVVVAGLIVAVGIRIFAGLRRRHQALESLYEFTRDVYSTVNTEDHAETVARLLRDAFRADGAALVRYDERDGIVVTAVGTGGVEGSAGTDADKAAFRASLRQAANHVRRVGRDRSGPAGGAAINRSDRLPGGAV